MQQQEKKSKDLWKLTESYKKDYQPDVEKGLVLLKSKMNRTPVVGLTPATNRTPTMKRVSMRIRLTQMAAAVLLLIGLGASYQLFFTTNTNIQQLHATNTPVSKILPDGSEILLNKNSHLSFPEKFEKGKRVVQLEGEAFFKIKKDTKRPFIVKTIAAKVEVLGTSFTLRAYEDEPMTSLHVAEGRVALHVPDKSEETILEANQKTEYLRTGGKLEEITDIHWADTAWHTPKLTFDSTPLFEIVKYLNSNFDVQIEILSPDLAQCGLTATLVNNDLVSILKRIDNTFEGVELNNTDSPDNYSLSGVCQ